MIPTKPSEKLATSLEALQALQAKGLVAIRSKDLSRLHRQRLTKMGFLKEIIKGWYVPCHPGEVMGDSTIWYSSFWDFCAAYCTTRFGEEWCLSPEQSLLLHASNWTIFKQLIVRSPKGRNKITKLLFETSILDVRQNMPCKEEIQNLRGLNVFSVTAGLIYCSSKFFTQYPIEARTILSLINDPTEILRLLLQGGHSTIAGRLVGAFRNIGNDDIADNIVTTMESAGYAIRANDPFASIAPISFNLREKSPAINRLRILWSEMRQDVIKLFPKSPQVKISASNYLKDIDEKYELDAYNSLSIEGYQVSANLINRVRSGKWSPDTNRDDMDHKNALAARGYWQAFQSVKESVQQIIAGENAGKVVRRDHGNWYRELFEPSIMAGILETVHLAGYRNSQVYIPNSMHVPPNKEVVRELMPVFFELLENEPDAGVRVILGHFFFVYIHPYMDGNGRLGRFLMNTMFASGGYPWLIITVEQRKKYMETLEIASVLQDIIPFCKFILEQCRIT